MKKIFFLFILMSFFSDAQTYRFIYQYEYRMDAADAEKKQEYYHLDINPDKTYYYERKYFVTDSLHKANQPFGFEGAMTDLIMKDYKNQTVSVTTFKGFDSFLLKTILFKIGKLRMKQNPKAI